MSPEQIEGGEVDHRSDIFAVGAVCYELFSYSEAFSGANTRRSNAGCSGEAGALTSVVPGLSRDRRHRPARAETGSEQTLSGRRHARESTGPGAFADGARGSR